jgi:hypothetical protein
MANLDLAKFVEEFFAGWLGGNHPGELSAVQVTQAVADAGYNPAELSDLNVGQLYDNACHYPGVPAEYQSAPHSYSTPTPTVEQVVRQIQQVTEVHNYNQQIFDNSTNIDNSVNLDDVTVDGDLDIDNENSTATDGSVAGHGDVVGATNGSAASGTGDANNASGGSTLIDGDNFGNANSGDGAAQVGGTTLGLGGFGRGEVLTRELDPSGVPGVAGHPGININTGSGDQQVANVQGDHNLTNFGDGAHNQQVNAPVLDSALSNDGDAHNISHNQADHGSAIGEAGDDISGGYEHDEYQTIVDNQGSFHSPVIVDQGDGDHENHQDNSVDEGDHAIMPI